MPAEHRTDRRRHLIYYLKVYDDQGDTLLGYLVDITPGGIRLMGREPIEPGRNLRMHMQLPEEMFDERRVSFVGTSRWCGADVNPDFYDIGIKVTDLTIDFTKTARKLIARIGFSD